ncbi:MAG: glutamine--fructose-6-phosphate transaminase (isomerizing), partial [Tissierellia bacterium]|nr:glutamine--fructose-6-phosphate transaminase (isomerizing) [Tissierellia bacterium]
TWDMTQAEKGGYDTFTLKEIHEQPKALAETINHRIKQGVIDLSLDLPQEDLQALKRIYIVACGTAYHAGLIGKRLIEQLVELPVQVEIASEFRSVVPFLSPDDLVIAVSQSGETIDTLQAVRMARSAGAKIISILNVVGSSLARESDGVLYTWAGPEIGVASTKAYTTQVASLALLALQMKQQLDPEAGKMVQEILTELQALPETVEQILGIEQEIIELADQQAANERIIFMGRGVDYYTALEASLKLKEISYINCLAMPAGEMKHGTIALVEDGSWVVGFLTQSETYDKMISNLKEVRARGAKVLAITTLSDEALADASDHIIHLPQVNQAFAPMISVIPAQLLAYYIATARGLDVDQPRNLAKSVTVE